MQNEIIYFDENGKIVEKDKAVRAVIRELDEKGNLVREIFGTVNNEIEEEITDEEFDSLSK